MDDADPIARALFDDPDRAAESIRAARSAGLARAFAPREPKPRADNPPEDAAPESSGKRKTAPTLRA